MAAAPPKLEPAVAKSLKDVPQLPRDAAVVALARRYARVIDEARQLAEELAAVEPESDAQAEVIRRLSAKVDAQVVMSDLGPKLLAALNSLGMTPQARASAKGGPTGATASPAAAALAALRAGHTAPR